MKRIVTILSSVCFLALPLFLSGGTLHAMVEDSPQLDMLRQQNEQLKQTVEELKKELDQMKLQMEDQRLKSASQANAKDKELSAMEQLKELMTGQMQDQLKAKDQYLQAFEQLQEMQNEQLRPQVEKGLDAARRAVEMAQKALENVEVPGKMEEFLRQYLSEEPGRPDARKASEMLAELQKAKAKQATSQQRLAQALEQYENALRQTTPQQLSKVLRDRMLSQLAKQGDISRKAQSLEQSILSKDDMGLLTQLRFEKVDLCRELGKLDEAADELEQIIEESLDTRVRTSARWMLIELLQEAGKRDEALKELMNMIQATTDPKEKRSILYAIIQMAGDDPEDRLKATEEVIEWLEESVREAQEKAERAACADNLKRLINAMHVYAMGHDRRFPEKLSDLHGPFVTDVELFTCPSQHGPKLNKEEIDSQTSYVYRGKLAIRGVRYPEDEVVIYDKPGNHDGEGGNVGFFDTHVEWVDAETLRKIAEKDRQADEERTKRAACTSNLKNLARAMYMYASEHDGKFPEKLSDVFPEYVDSTRVFTCPSEGGPEIGKEEIDSETSYVYRRGLAITDVESPATEVLIYDKPGNHDGEGGNVGFVDAHVEWVDAERLRKIAEIDRKASPEPEADPML